MEIIITWKCKQNKYTHENNQINYPYRFKFNST